MTITHSVQQEFLDDESKSLICIPCRTSSRVTGSADNASPHVVVRPAESTRASPKIRKGERWTEDEHERFLLGMEMFKAGPWKKIAGVVGTRDARQTMSHAQKYRQKIKRRKLVMQTPDNAQRAEPQPEPDECAAAPTTKKRRTMTGAAAAVEAADRVVTSTRSAPVSSTVQLSRQEGAATSGLAQDLLEAEHVSGPIVSETDGMASTPSTVSSAVVGAGDERGDLQLDANLEPLDIDVDISVMQNGWLGPDELWGFLQRPSRE